MANLVAAIYLKRLFRSETKRRNVIADPLSEQSATQELDVPLQSQKLFPAKFKKSRPSSQNKFPQNIECQNIECHTFWEQNVSMMGLSQCAAGTVNTEGLTANWLQIKGNQLFIQKYSPLSSSSERSSSSAMSSNCSPGESSSVLSSLGPEN